MWYVYIVQCSDKSYYTGITTDIEKRWVQHNKGKASKYTRSRRPVEVLYSEKFKRRSAALIRELEIKKLKRKDKIKLVAVKKDNNS